MRIIGELSVTLRAASSLTIRGFAANLPQLLERIENRDARCGQAPRRDGVTDPCIHRFPDAEIEGICAKITNLRLLATRQYRVHSPIHQPAH